MEAVKSWSLQRLAKGWAGVQKVVHVVASLAAETPRCASMQKNQNISKLFMSLQLMPHPDNYSHTISKQILDTKSDILSGKYFDILSGIPSGIYFDILSESFWHISFADILSGILFGSILHLF